MFANNERQQHWVLTKECNGGGGVELHPSKAHHKATRLSAAFEEASFPVGNQFF